MSINYLMDTLSRKEVCKIIDSHLRNSMVHWTSVNTCPGCACAFIEELSSKRLFWGKFKRSALTYDVENGKLIEIRAHTRCLGCMFVPPVVSFENEWRKALFNHERRYAQKNTLMFLKRFLPKDMVSDIYDFL